MRSHEESIRREERANRVALQKRIANRDRRERALAQKQRAEQKLKPKSSLALEPDSGTEEYAQAEGQVIRIDRDFYTVLSDSQMIKCILSGKLAPCVIGDLVQFRLIPGIYGFDGEITSILPRRNKFSRGSSGNGHLEQVFGANLDSIVIFMACKSPDTNWGMINRILVTAGREGIAPLIVINKIDLLSGIEREKLCLALTKYEQQGYETLLVSVANGIGIDALEARLQDKVSILVGMSGTGKSSLLNILIGESIAKTGHISEATNKGRHTTTSSFMHSLRGGGYIIDTPGIRSFSLWDMGSTDIKEFFCDFGHFAGTCKFNDCMHLNEPDDLCAVKQAVLNGEIPEELYMKYRSLVRNQIR